MEGFIVMATFLGVYMFYKMYKNDQEAEEIGVHSKKNMLFVRQIPGLKDYLVSVLNDFYNIRRDVLIEIEKCKVTAEQQ